MGEDGDSRSSASLGVAQAPLLVPFGMALLFKAAMFVCLLVAAVGADKKDKHPVEEQQEALVRLEHGVEDLIHDKHHFEELPHPNLPPEVWAYDDEGRVVWSMVAGLLKVKRNWDPKFGNRDKLNHLLRDCLKVCRKEKDREARRRDPTHENFKAGHMEHLTSGIDAECDEECKEDLHLYVTDKQLRKAFKSR